MTHSFAHGRLAKRLCLIAALALGGTLVVTSATSATDRLDIRTVSLSVGETALIGDEAANHAEGNTTVTP